MTLKEFLDLIIDTQIANDLSLLDANVSIHTTMGGQKHIATNVRGFYFDEDNNEFIVKMTCELN